MAKEYYWKLDIKESQGTTIKEKFLRNIWNCVYFLFYKHTPEILFSKWRIFLLRCFGAKIGKDCYIGPQTVVYEPWHLILKDHVTIDNFCFIKCETEVFMDDNVNIACCVKIIPGGHDVRARNFKNNKKPVYIGKSTFVGLDSYIFGGVSIGQFSVIGARSTVTKDIPDNVIAFGYPAEVHSEHLPKEEYEKYDYSYEFK